MKSSPQHLSKISLAVAHCFAGIQKAEELEPFLALVEDLEPQRILEIGRWTGGTLWALAKIAADDALLVSVDNDMYTPRHQHLTEDAIRNADQRVVFIDGDSHTHDTMYDVINAAGGERYDLLFIDGDHSYEGVKEDWIMYSPLVRMGGMIAFHDILKHPDGTDCEVEKFWNQLKAGPCPTREIIADDRGPNSYWSNSCGIGVVEITPDVIHLRAREYFE